MEIEHQKKNYNFPSINCPDHNSSIIFVCTNPDCEEDHIFLCAICLKHDLSHMTKHQPLTLYDEFVHMLSEDTILFEHRQPDEDLLINADIIINNYLANSETNKKDIKEVLEKIRVIHNEKNHQIWNNVQQNYEESLENLQHSFKLLRDEKKTEPKHLAKIASFTSMSHELNNINSSLEKINFLKDVLRKRQAWQKASHELKSFSKNSYIYYENKFRQLLENQPDYQKNIEIENLVEKKISKLYNKINLILDNTYPEETQYIELKVSEPSELRLVTNEMIQENTLIIFAPKNKVLEINNLNTYLTELNNFKNLAFHLDEIALDVKSIESLFSKLETFDLKTLEISVIGCFIDDVKLETLIKNIEKCSSLQNLTLNLEHNSFKNVNSLNNLFHSLKNITELSLNLSYNHINTLSMGNFLDNLRELSNLVKLKLHISGFSLINHLIDDSHCTTLGLSLKKMTGIKVLSLDIGNNPISDFGIKRLTKGIKKIKGIKKLELTLNSIKMENGIKKIGKILRKVNLCWIYLNLHSNNISEESVKDVLNFTKNCHLKHVEINIRNIGLNRNAANKIKNENETDKVKIIV